VTAAADDHALLASLEDDLKFVFITSAIALARGDALAVAATPSQDPKCERCWHWRADVGSDPAHPEICGRCVSNLYGAGEPRVHA
jgi:isoleucyl-tRNA synthetase